MLGFGSPPPTTNPTCHCFSRVAGNRLDSAMKKQQQMQRKGDRSSAVATASPPYYVGGRMIRYGECQKNHAAKIGGFAVDGCREFMASLGVNELKCAACGCHRNFHRREVEVEDSCECSSPYSDGK